MKVLNHELQDFIRHFEEQMDSVFFILQLPSSLTTAPDHHWTNYSLCVFSLQTV